MAHYYTAYTACNKAFTGESWSDVRSAIIARQAGNIGDLDAPYQIAFAHVSTKCGADVPMPSDFMASMNDDLETRFAEDKQNALDWEKHVAEVSSPYWSGRI